MQGLGAGAPFSLARSILRDKLSGTELARIASYLAMENIAIMTSAPLLGGYVQEFFDWRDNFLVLFIFSIGLFLLVLFKYQETNVHKNKKYIKKAFLLKSAKSILTNPHFLSNGFCIFFTYGTILCWITMGTLILQNHFEFSPSQYGWTEIGVGIIYASGGFINGKLVRKIGTTKMTYFGLCFMVIGGLFTLVTVNINSWVLFLLSIYIFIFGTVFIFANGIAVAINPFPKIAGLAGALLAFLEILGGGLFSTISAMVFRSTQLHLGLLLFGISVIAALSFVLLNVRQVEIHP